MINGKEKLEFKKGKTDRGFGLFSFTDLYDNECSIQKSSIATADCFWIGIDCQTGCGPKVPINARMHLNVKQVRQLCNKLLEILEEYE